MSKFWPRLEVFCLGWVCPVGPSKDLFPRGSELRTSPRVPEPDDAEISELKKEVPGLRPANNILRKGPALLQRSSTDPRRDHPIRRCVARPFLGLPHLPGLRPSCRVGLQRATSRKFRRAQLDRALTWSTTWQLIGQFCHLRCHQNVHQSWGEN